MIRFRTMRKMGAIAWVISLIWSGALFAEEFNPKTGGKAMLPEDWTFRAAEIRAVWNQLTDEEKREYGQFYLPHPIFPTDKNGPLELMLLSASDSISNAKTLTTKHFRIIWGQNYKDYINKQSASFINWGDSDLDGIPNFVEILAGSDPYDPGSPSATTDFGNGICENVWKKLIEEWGYKAPYGSEEHFIDVYIANTGVFNPAVEYSDPQNGVKLPTQVYGLTSTYQNGLPFIIINQDMMINVMKVTFAHEFSHAVQLSYVNLDELLEGINRWLAESTATWMEDAVYPDINNYVQYVNYWVDYPEEALFSTSPYEQYGGVLFMKYLTENYKSDTDPVGVNIIKKIWEINSEYKDPMKAISKYLKEQDTRPIHDLKGAYTEFAIKNISIKSSYVDGSKYDNIYILKSEKLDTNKETSHSVSVNSYSYAPSPYGANYVKLDISETDMYGLANRLISEFQLTGSYYGDVEPDFRVYVIFEEKDGKRSDPLQMTFISDSKGEFKKFNNLAFKSCYIVVIALPKEELDFLEYEKYFYNLNYNPYISSWLVEGWNLVSLPTKELSEITDMGLLAKSGWAWDQQAKDWNVFLPGVGEDLLNEYLQKTGFGKLTSVLEGQGVWFNIKAQAELEYLPKIGAQSINIVEGWNLVGIRVMGGFKVQDILKGCDIKTAWKWDPFKTTWHVYAPYLGDLFSAYVKDKGFEPLDRLYYGDGFWVNSGKSCEVSL